MLNVDAKEQHRSTEETNCILALCSLAETENKAGGSCTHVEKQFVFPSDKKKVLFMYRFFFPELTA